MSKSISEREKKEVRNDSIINLSNYGIIEFNFICAEDLTFFLQKRLILFCFFVWCIV